MSNGTSYAHLERLIAEEARRAALYLRITLGVGAVLALVAGWQAYTAVDPEPLTLLVSATGPFAVVLVPWQKYSERRDRKVQLETLVVRLRELGPTAADESESTKTERAMLESIAQRYFMRALEA